MAGGMAVSHPSTSFPDKALTVYTSHSSWDSWQVENVKFYVESEVEAEGSLQMEDWFGLRNKILP